MSCRQGAAVQWRGARLCERTDNEEVEGVSLYLHLPTGPGHPYLPLSININELGPIAILGIVVGVWYGLLPKSVLLSLIKQFGHLVWSVAVIEDHEKHVSEWGLVNLQD